ncbi:PREDICTED: GATA zinc finger domain-containing protein 1 [Aptenodytes forsteri]|uniref:GATA zinc finger domain-containing protein 1 n=1 Tax=Aptenodytes forsteri TaxID=9233 RepID=UPI0004F49159|nr:PREDICTED: GATA zinc finger domain-containing protein 1 [Aptenodytes forsteri]
MTAVHLWMMESSIPLQMGMEQVPEAASVLCYTHRVSPLTATGFRQDGKDTALSVTVFAESKQEIHRRSARLRNTKYKSAPAAEKKVSTKGKGRRHIFKLKNPIKAPESVSTIITAESIFYKGVYYQIGDVVSVVDEQDGKTYYAQIRGFIQDQYCEKSAALTWLIPTQASPKDCFDPASYIIGPEEDLPRKMEYLEFVCHAPSEYFKSRSSPFPTVPTRPEKGYIWTHVGPTPAISIKETVTNNL